MSSRGINEFRVLSGPAGDVTSGGRARTERRNPQSLAKIRWLTTGSSEVWARRSWDGLTFAAVQGTFSTGSISAGVAFDGANIWVAIFGGSVVTKLRASDGVLLGSVPVAGTPEELVFDGTSIWVTIPFGNTVSKRIAR